MYCLSARRVSRHAAPRQLVSAVKATTDDAQLPRARGTPTEGAAYPAALLSAHASRRSARKRPEDA